jgi:hypothetical protein
MTGLTKLVSDLNVGPLAREFRKRASGSPENRRVAVSGTLAEQLLRELGRGAEPGAVTLGGLDDRVGVVVHVLAGDPTSEDEAIVAGADRAGIPVVLVQVWPQADRGRPFVLTPFVVECRPGEGFPVPEIAARIADAAANPIALASRIPALQSPALRTAVSRAVARNAIRAMRGSPGRLDMTRDQVGLLLDVDALDGGPLTHERAALVGPAAAGIVALGFALRRAARAAESAPILPAPLVRVAVAVGGTLAVSALARALAARFPSS